MADVTITDLPTITPSRGLTVPASDGTTTGKLTITQIADQIVPIGSILLWSGSIASIPANWALCNGANGTPNLQDRFIVGAGSSYAVNGTGGSADAVVVSHTHAATDSGHTHSYIATSVTTENFGPTQTIFANNTVTNRTRTNTSGIYSGTAIITVAATGQSGTNQNLPPYYALAYIMRTS
jgi:microcystin-dependent protein